MMTDTTPKKTPIELRTEVIEARNAFYLGAGTEQAMNDAADRYIAAVVAHMKAKGKRSFRAPSRSYVLRAL